MAADTNSSPRGPRRRVLRLPPALLVAALLLAGCVSSGSLSPPPGGGVSTDALPPNVQNATGQIATTADVSGWTGLDIDTAMPVSLAGLLAWIVWLSHRREMGRIKGRNGK